MKITHASGRIRSVEVTLLPFLAWSVLFMALIFSIGILPGMITGLDRSADPVCKYDPVKTMADGRWQRIYRKGYRIDRVMTFDNEIDCLDWGG